MCRRAAIEKDPDKLPRQGKRQPTRYNQIGRQPERKGVIFGLEEFI
jgi:hypothetical protein